MMVQPVCESLGVQSPVDLTSRPCHRIGRSPGSDVQLLHATSSRRHALLFHHPNGSCYVVDCGSAHGTFVDGVRVPGASSPSSPNGGKGVVVPHRVRRGALVRFGGPGAPTFVLKSFSVGFEGLVRDLPGVDVADDERPSSEDEPASSSSDEDSMDMDELLSRFPSPGGNCETEPKSAEKLEADAGSHGGLRRVVSKEGEDGAPMDSPSPSPRETSSPAADPTEAEAALVRLNTRLNALGGAARLPTASGRRLARRASARLVRALRPSSFAEPSQHRRRRTIQKRPRTPEPATEEEGERMAKKARANGSSSIEMEAELKLPTFPAIVSPVTSKILLSPDSSRVPPPPLLSMMAPTPVQLRETLTLASSDAFKSLLIPSSGDLKGRRPRADASNGASAASGRRVRFSDESPQLFYPASITPDELSADEGDLESPPSFALAPTPPTTPRAMLAGI